MVLTPKLISLGVGVPLHPYIKKILKWYDVAPVQLSPNSYKLAWALYIMYHNLRLGAPSMKEFSFFYSIRKSIPGYHFLVVNKWLNNKGFNEGKISHERDWKEPFLYIYDIRRTRVRFNLEPNKRVQKELTGKRKKRVDKVLQYAEKHFNLKDMITEDNLKLVGALSSRVGSICKFHEFHNGKPVLTISEKTRGLSVVEVIEIDISKQFDLEQDMASLPKGFAIGASKKLRARKQAPTKVDSKAKIPPPIATPSTPPKIIDTTVLDIPERVEDAPSKRQKTVPDDQSFVLRYLGASSIGDFSEDEVRGWTFRTEQQTEEAMVRAAAELHLHARQSANMAARLRACLAITDTAKSKAEDKVKSLERYIILLAQEKDAEIRRLEGERMLLISRSLKQVCRFLEHEKEREYISEQVDDASLYATETLNYYNQFLVDVGYKIKYELVKPGFVTRVMLPTCLLFHVNFTAKVADNATAREETFFSKITSTSGVFSCKMCRILEPNELVSGEETGNKTNGCYYCHEFNNVWHPRYGGFLRGGDSLYMSEEELRETKLEYRLRKKLRDMKLS
ncbi:hypothetical protein AgCh_004615 [Apium graveolens]